MEVKERDDSGKFAAKGDSIRVVRSIRLTDETWDVLGEKADSLGISKADFLEALCKGEIDWESDDIDTEKPELDFDPDEVAEILQEALTFKPNAGGKIKAKIRQVLDLMGVELEDN